MKVKDLFAPFRTNRATERMYKMISTMKYVAAVTGHFQNILNVLWRLDIKNTTSVWQVIVETLHRSKTKTRREQ
jgi:hypothetical protein